jgi:mono/diheme cytochrome c family protein
MKQLALGFRSAAVLACASTLWACAAGPEPVYEGDPWVGREVAQDFCASCHSIERIGASPHPAAPPLRYVLATYNPDRLVADLDNAVSISHLRMPTFYFGDHHPADLVAYLKTIQQTPPPPSAP